jgi:DNA-binding transcriptional LysR family regulator
MFSYHELITIESVARLGSFSHAAEELHKVPSAISYTIKSVEDRLTVTLFTRLHRKVVLTAAGEYFVEQARKLLKEMEDIRLNTQRVANGWQQSVSVALDNVVREDSVNQLVRDFYATFPDIELQLTMEVFNGVWDALMTGRADIGIGATATIPIGGNFSYRPMGELSWDFVMSTSHPLADYDGAIPDSELMKYPVICLEDTSRMLPKRTTWQLDNQRRLIVPNWHSAEQCFIDGLGVGVIPSHKAKRLLSTRKIINKQIENNIAPSPCCLAWNTNNQSIAIQWLLDYLGETEKLNTEWLKEI